MGIQLLDEECPQCGEMNWVYNGDTADLTGVDVEAIRCWACRHEFLIDDSDPILQKVLGVKSPGDAYIADGKRTASEAAGR